MTEITYETTEVPTGEPIDASAECPSKGPPLFRGLVAVGITGKEIAAALRVSTASVSKWRNGHASIPDDTRVFLTLMLGDQISRAAEYGGRAAADDGGLEDARSALRHQEQLNGGLPAMAVREGAKRYRLWWNATRNATYLKPDDLMRDLGAQVAFGIR